MYIIESHFFANGFRGLLPGDTILSNADLFLTNWAIFRMNCIMDPAQPLITLKFSSLDDTKKLPEPDEVSLPKDSLFFKYRLKTLLCTLAIQMANIFISEDFEFATGKSSLDKLFEAAKDEKSHSVQHLDELAKSWEGVRSNTLQADVASGMKSQSGTVHSQVFFDMLQAFWKVSDGFVDFGSGRGIAVLFASFWATCSVQNEDPTVVGGIEKDPMRLLDSVMLLACGECLAKKADFLNLRWPKIELVLGDLNNVRCWTNNQSKFGFLNNFCFPLNKDICNNACKFLKQSMLACFKFEKIASESDDCITCVATFQNMGQWNDSTVFVLECCSRYFTTLDAECKTKINEWLQSFESRPTTSSLSNENMFWSIAAIYLQANTSDIIQNELKRHKIGGSDDVDKFAKCLFTFAKEHQDYSAMRLMYRPFFLTGVALMLYLEVLKWSFKNQTVFQENTESKVYLVEAIEMVSHRTLPFSHGVHESSTSMMEFANITKVVSRGSRKTKKKEKELFSSFDSINDQLLCDMKQSCSKAVISCFQRNKSNYHNNICVVQFAHFSELQDRCEKLDAFKQINNHEMVQVCRQLFADLIGTTRELTLNLLTPIIRDEKKINADEFEKYLSIRRGLNEQKSGLVGLIVQLRISMNDLKQGLFKDFDSVYCVTSIETFLQSEIDFEDQNAELCQQIFDEIEYFKKYLDASVTEYAKTNPHAEIDIDQQIPQGDLGLEEALEKANREAAERLKTVENERLAAEKSAEKRKRDEEKKREREKLEKEALADAELQYDIRILSNWRTMPIHIKDKTGF